MMTNAAPTMRLLLLKAEGQFKHSGKHFLMNGRWHALHKDKPVPKGAAIAAHPQAAGQHLPATLSADEVEALKYPADKAAGNHEMKNWNEKHLPELLGHAANGDATAIIGMSFGVNTHGKKKALVANHLLSKMGSKHTVKPGQKAGEHEAVQGAPAEAAPVQAAAPVADAGPKDGDTKEGADGTLVFKDGRWHKQESTATTGKDSAVAEHQAKHTANGTPTVTHDGKEWYVLNTGSSNADGKVMAHLASTTEGKPQKNGFYPLQMSDWIDPAKIQYPKSSDQNPEDAAPEPAGQALSMPAFSGGTVGQSVIDYYEGVAQKVLSLANAGDVAALEQMKQDGLKPNKKGKVSNTWAGKTPNSKILLALHAEAMQHAGKAAAVQHLEQDQKQGDIPASEKAEDKHLVAEIKDKTPAEAVAAAVEHLKGDKDQGNLPAAEKKEDAELVQKLEAAQAIPTKAAGKQAAPDAESVPLLQIMGASMLNPAVSALAFKGDNPVWYSQQSPTQLGMDAKSSLMGSQPTEHAKKTWELVQAAKAAGYNFTSYMKASGGLQGVYLLQKNGHVLTKKGAEALMAGSAAEPAAEAAPAKKEPRLVLPKKAATPIAAAAPAGNSKLNQIPWDSLKLPDSNKNAKSHNKQVEKIKALAYAGDIAGLEAFKAGSNTYGKKQNLLAQTALAALKEGGAPVAAEPDKYALTPDAKEVIDTLGENAQHGGITGLQHVMSANPAGSGLHEYAKQKLAEVQKPSASAPAKPDVSPSVMWQEVVDEIEQAISSGDSLKIEHAIANSEGLRAPGALKANQYAKAALAYLKGEQPDTGPKEGDTKMGADGMLVLKNGRWVKVDKDQPAQQQAAAAEPVTPAKKLTKEEKEAAIKAAVDAVQIPDFAGADSHHYSEKYGQMAEKIKAAVLAEGMAGFKAHITTGADGSFASKSKVLGFKTNKCFESSKEPRRAMFWKFCSEMKAALESQKGPTKPVKPKAAPAPQAPATPASPTIESMDTWTQTGPQGGSNPGGRFKDANGEEWYCKFPADEDTAKAEVLAAKLYAALGIAGQDAKLITKGGKVGIASKWTTVSKASSPSELAKVDGVAAGFGADAWLANWDVVGLGYDNLQIGADGKAHRVDAGGSLMYRAQGGKKAFGNVVTEIDSLRDPKINPQAAAVFGGMTDADITASVAKVLALPDASIRAICYQHGPGSEADRKALAETLIARKNDLAAKFPKAAKPKKKRLDPNNLPVDPSQLPKRHDFSNWNGPGKGLSSKPHVNAANASVEQEVIELAKTGNLTKLKDFHFHEIDKETGTATGKMIPIKNHPSKHVVQFHADVVQLLDEIANPPEPLKIFAETDVPTLDALAAAFPPKPFGTTVDSVKSNEKLGFWVVLGGASGVEKFKPKKVMDYTSAAVAAAHQKYKDAKPLAKHFINSVQASGSYNDLFRNGKETDGHGNKLTDVAKAALEQATEMPEGTSLYRWQNMSDDMVKKIMSAPDGTVFQATGPMCTSYSSTATSGFGQHRVTIRYAKGAKGVESFGSGNFKGEKEVTTLPNSRFVILGKKMVPNEKQPGKQRLELEVLMLPPDLGIADAIM